MTSRGEQTTLESAEQVESTVSDPTTTAEAPQEVTLRGDLEQIELGDVFQTLAMSKMEGLLHLSNPLEQRVLHFREGFVKVLPSGRAEAQRIGSCLLRAGLVDEAQLRDALQRQRDLGSPLGEILIDEGAVTHQEVLDALSYQSAEDLYSLFTWRSGGFEFYKGTPQNAEVQGKIELAPAFEASSVLLEAARRSDEWELILRALHSIDEVLVPRFQLDQADELPEDHARVMMALDGTRSVREVPDVTMMGLFDSARAARDLLEQGFLDLAPVSQMLAASDAQRGRGDARRGMVTLRTLVDRDQPMTQQETRDLAAALERYGDTRTASRCLCRASQESVDAEEALDLAREAARLDKRSSAVLEYLRDLLEKAGVEGQEIIDTTSALAEALVTEGREQAALAEMERLEELGCDRLTLLTRRARLLQRLERTPEAVENLLQLAELLQLHRRGKELPRVYEQILKLDGTRRDIAQKLNALRRSQGSRRARLIVGISTTSAILVAGVVVHRQYRVQQRLQETVADVRARMTTEEPEKLRAEIAEAVADLGDRPELAALASEVSEVNERKALAERQEKHNALRVRLADAADHMERGALAAALDTYQALLHEGGFRTEVEEVLENRVGALPPLMQRLATALPLQLPGMPTPVQSETQRRQLLSNLEKTFLDIDWRRAQGVVAARDHPRLQEVLGDEKLRQLVTDAEKVCKAFEAAREQAAAYRRSLARSATQRELEPVFLRAQQNERTFRFDEAVADYRRLVEEYPVDDGMKAEFQRRLDRYEALLSMLRDLRAASDAGDHDEALQLLRALQKSEPDVPFDRLVELPLVVTTVPAGARVKIAGADVGVTPLHTTYHPAAETPVAVQLDGFHPATVTIRDGNDAELSFVLAKAPSWSTHVGGSVQRRPVVDAEGRVFLTDRSGGITAIELDGGQTVWSHTVDDLNGLLPSPALAGDDVLVASFDGTLRAFTRKSGALHWQCDGLSCEASPLVVDELAVLATVEGEVVGIDTTTGTPRWRHSLPGPVSVDPTGDEDLIYVTTSNGFVVCLEPRQGREVWRQRIAPRIAAPPALASGAVFVASDEGLLVCLSRTDGSVRWQRDGLGEVVLQPWVTSGRVVVVSGRALRTFAVADGAPGPGMDSDDVWSSTPASLEGLLFVGQRGGEVLALDASDLHARFRIEGDGTLTAQPMPDSQGRLVLAFENGVVQAFPCRQ